MEHHVLILGSLPPPVGGVSIHVQRLVDALEKNAIPFSFLSLKSSFCTKRGQKRAYCALRIKINMI